MSHPVGEAANKYSEVCILIEAYAKKLAAGGSYADMLRHIDRLNQLAGEARKLWGGQ